MFDVIADLIETLLSDGVPSPDRLEKQRQARLAVSLVALIGNSSIYLTLGVSSLRGWPVLLLVGWTLAAGWVLVFSVVDTAKELPTVSWMSIAAALAAAAGIAVAAVLAPGLIPAERPGTDPQMRVALLSLLVALGSGGVAYADSDGYYCVGRGYVAYQFGMAPLPVASHRLYVLRLEPTGGIPEPTVIELPQFQVHGLRCGGAWIDVASFTAVYRVTLDDAVRPTGYQVRPFGEGRKVPPEFFPQRNLGMLSPARASRQPDRVSLGAKAGGGQFLLEMTGRLIPNERCVVALTTRVVETDRNGREIRERIIFEGRGYVECGGEQDSHPA
jgi:uncharacterized membrane protein